MTNSNGQLPKGWRKARLGDFVTRLTNGYVGPTREIYVDNGVPYLLARHVHDNILTFDGKTFVSEEFTRRHRKSVLKAGDVLMVQSGHVGQTAVVPPEHEGHNCHAMIVISPVLESLDGRYLSYFFHSPEGRPELDRLQTGATLPHLNCRDVENVTIPLPPLSEQRRIAAILDKAEAIRRNRQEAIRLTDELLGSVFLEMFGDPVSHDSKPLSEIAAVVSGVTKGRKLNGRAIVVPYLRVANVQDGFLNLDEIKTIEALPEEVENLALRLGDIVMTEGGDHDKLGRGAIWNHGLSPCIHQNHIFRVRLNQDLMLPDYFAAYLRTREAKSYFLRCAKKTTNLASINMTQLRGLPVPLPTIEIQREFRKAANTIVELSATRKRATRESDQLFASLVQRAFRGEL
jgi:type I restriction enzyme, S subunit